MKILLILLTIFRVAFVGDPQVDNATELSYARKSIYKELRERKDIDLIIFLGDLVNDAPALLEGSLASIDSIGKPWFSVPGNHDRDFYRGEKGKPRDLQSWIRNIGYVDTTFTQGSVRFILMNDVRTKGTADYEAGLSDSQKLWLKETLDNTPLDQTTVIATHIPLTEMHAQDTLAQLITGRKNLLLASAHTHQVRRETLDIGGTRVENLVAGTSCGSWWRGFKDEDGVPDALMNCGAPRCWFIADFIDNDFTLHFKQVASDAQASATIQEDGSMLVNVFGGSRDGVLRVKGKKGSFHAAEEMAPEVKERIAFNSEMTREYRRDHKEEYIPLLKRNSPHVWSIPDCSRFKGKKISVRYSDAHMSFKTRIRVR